MRALFWKEIMPNQSKTECTWICIVKPWDSFFFTLLKLGGIKKLKPRRGQSIKRKSFQHGTQHVLAMRWPYFKPRIISESNSWSYNTISLPITFCIELTAGTAMDTVETQVVDINPAPELDNKEDEIPASQPRSPVVLPENSHPDLPASSQVGNVFCIWVIS